MIWSFWLEDKADVIMWPSVQLQSIDSKLSLKMVSSSLQLVPELLELDPPPVSKHDARLLWRFLISDDLEL